jgi:hypothetical protein
LTGSKESNATDLERAFGYRYTESHACTLSSALTTPRGLRMFPTRYNRVAVDYVKLKECHTLFSAANEILFQLAGEGKLAREIYAVGLAGEQRAARGRSPPG